MTLEEKAIKTVCADCGLVKLGANHCKPKCDCFRFYLLGAKENGLVWVKHERYGTENLIIAFDNDNESIGGSCVFIQDMWVDMQELFDNFTFLDGSPCGILE